MDTSAYPSSSIRAATSDDVPAILSLIRELAAYEHLTDQCVATEADLRTHLFGDQRVGETLVAEVKGVVVGYAICFRTFSTFLAKPGLYLEDIYVQPAHRKAGLGKAMLREVCRLAVVRGYGRVEWAVLKWNEPSIRFYKSFGAASLEEWQTFRLDGDALRQAGGSSHRQNDGRGVD